MEPTKDDHDLATTLSQLHRQVGAVYSTLSRQFGLTMQQLQLLCLLEKRRPSFGELAALLGCDKTNVTGMVDRLERRELLRRTPDPEDRRVSRIVLTEEGEILGQQARSAFAKVVAESLGDWPATRRRDLGLLTQAVIDALG